MNPLIRRFDPSEEYYFEEGCYIHELSNDMDDPLMSVARARLPLGGQTRWHRLHKVVERYLIEAGEEPLVFLAICTPRFEPDCYEDLET